MSYLTESTVEDTTLSWFEDLGCEVLFGPDIAFDGPEPEREPAANYSDVILSGRLREALAAINPNIPDMALDDAIRKVTRTESPSLVENNRRFHRMLTDGVDISYMADGREVHDKVWLLDIEDLTNNDWLGGGQITPGVGDKKSRPPNAIFLY